MSERNVILLAAGMLVLGLIVGALLGGATGFFMGRESVIVRNPYGQGYALPMPPNPNQTPNARGQAPLGQPGSLQFAGVRVTDVEKDTPASKAGVQVGDVITAFGGTKLDQTNSLSDLVKAKKVGDKVELSITRNEQPLTLIIELGAAPQSNTTPYLGIRFAPAIQGGGRFR